MYLINNFDIWVFILCVPLRLKSLSINPNARSIVLRTMSLAKLGVLPLKKLLYSYLIVNVFLYLLYALGVCSLSKSDLSSINFAFNRFFMKLFSTNNIKTVKSIQLYLSISLPSVVLGNRSAKFELSFGLFAR